MTGSPRLLLAVCAAAALVVGSRHAGLRAQLREVRASRARIVESADADRRRVERALHDGAQQRLVAVALSLTVVRTRVRAAESEEIDTLLDETGRELAAALEELRELARGVFPVLLTDAGLGPALTALAERCPIPAVVRSAPAERLSDVVERTVYFVVAEALADAATRSGTVGIDVREVGGTTTVEVVDDGPCRADGPGRQGPADRVAAAGGVLRVTHPAAGGTRLYAELPPA